jgi:FkbM family methyltransferase
MIVKNYFELEKTLQDKKLIFWGTGKHGEYFYSKYCIEKKLLPKPLFWCDNNKAKHGSFIDGVPVISPEELTKMLHNTSASDDYVIVIMTVPLFSAQIASQLLLVGLYYFQIYAAWHLDSYFYFHENKEKVKLVEELLTDKKSKFIYKKIIENMCNGCPISFDLFEKNPYYNNDVVPMLQDNAVIADGGAYDGKHVDRALALNPKIKIHAFEPNKESMDLLKEKYINQTNVILHEKGLWNKKEEIYFDSSEISGAQIVKTKDNATTKIVSAPLDEEITGKVDLIKMDIEGAEYNALLGAEKTIKKYHPKLTICTYHKVEDYIELPLLIKKFDSNYKFYFRQHSTNLEESVVYAL